MMRRAMACVCDTYAFFLSRNGLSVASPHAHTHPSRWWRGLEGFSLKGGPGRVDRQVPWLGREHAGGLAFRTLLPSSHTSFRARLGQVLPMERRPSAPERARERSEKGALPRNSRGSPVVHLTH